MQSQADGEFKFIMVYQDHPTKFLQLRALETKRAEEVAYHLLDVFTIFGAPCILHTDNGREFANKVIEELCHMWNEPKIVHGKPRHSQSQGSIERANQDIEKMLSTLLETNKTTKWSEGLKFIQFMKNKVHHSGINQSPYEAMFGSKAKVGLKIFLPAFDTLSKITREEEPESILKQQYDNHPEHQSEDVATDSERCSNESSDRTFRDLQVSQSAEIESVALNKQNSLIASQSKDPQFVGNTTTNTVSQKILEARNFAKQSLEKQADKMLKRSNAKFPVAEIGQSVRIKVPEIDRAKADSRNIIAVIISVEKDSFYKLGTKYDTLNQLYSRNEFTICKEKFISINEVLETDITLRECARKGSNLGGQGFQHCNCTAECNSNRCKCKKLHILCNSKCHKTRSCNNK
ncbi:uncharacterized protein [Onthophagus taurus]|uniref:uncharacterized protein n=1 Tax=Onthophagus taurus TaxID=166361 RepID=UPI000C20DDF0|nr:uncharacterized protein LOC111422503 [Onthophagus taurus]